MKQQRTVASGNYPPMMCRHVCPYSNRSMNSTYSRDLGTSTDNDAITIALYFLFLSLY